MTNAGYTSDTRLLSMVHRGNYGSDETTLRAMLRAGEKVKAMIYGYSKIGFVLVTMTNERIIFIDKKLMYQDVRESPLDLITGISYDKQVVFVDITISLKSGDYTVRTLNTSKAHRFIESVEEQCLHGPGIARSNA